MLLWCTSAYRALYIQVALIRLQYVLGKLQRGTTINTITVCTLFRLCCVQNTLQELERSTVSVRDMVAIWSRKAPARQATRGKLVLRCHQYVKTSTMMHNSTLSAVCQSYQAQRALQTINIIDLWRGIPSLARRATGLDLYTHRHTRVRYLNYSYHT